MGGIKNRFRKNLKKIRLEKGLTQEQLSDKLGCSVKYIQKLESTESQNVGIEKLEELAKILKVRPSLLIE